MWTSRWGFCLAHKIWGSTSSANIFIYFSLVCGSLPHLRVNTSPGLGLISFELSDFEHRGQCFVLTTNLSLFITTTPSTTPLHLSSGLYRTLWLNAQAMQLPMHDPFLSGCLFGSLEHRWGRDIVGSQSRLGLVSVSSRSRLSKVSVSRFDGLGLARDYSIETTRPEEEKMKIEAWKKHSVGSRFQYSYWKIMFFIVEKYLTRKISGLGLGLGLRL